MGAQTSTLTLALFFKSPDFKPASTAIMFRLNQMFYC